MIPREPLPLEDASGDIIAKAMAGLGLSRAAVAEKAGIGPEVVGALLEGSAEAPDLEKVAAVLRLHGPSLRHIAEGRWHPSVRAPQELICCPTPFPVSGYPEMTVNAYGYVHEPTRSVLLFDAGATAHGMLRELEERRLEVRAIYLTHAHRDHLGGLAELRQAWPEVPVWIDSKEPVPGTRPIEAEGPVAVGPFVVESRATPGHSAGGRTYVLHSDKAWIAFVGDALFAGSMGGAAAHYTAAKAAIERQILALPEDTVLCPGHGPLTTVGVERRHNPFFAG